MLQSVTKHLEYICKWIQGLALLLPELEQVFKVVSNYLD